MRNTIALLLLWAPSVLALNTRSAVSISGLDTNPCTPASPCRSFSVAIAATAATGEVIALDSAGYGPFTVPDELTISGAPGAHAAITATSGDGITVNAGTSDRVVLRNLILISAGATVGVHDSVSKEATVIGCLIRGFNSGILVDTNASNLSVQHCTILDGGGSVGSAGVNQTAGGNFHRVVVSDSLIDGNFVGIHADQPSEYVVADTTLSRNLTSSIEVYATTGTGVTTTLTAKRCTIVHSGYGVFVTMSGQNNVAGVALSQNVIAFNTYGVDDPAGGASTFKNNRLVFNAIDVAGFALATDTLQ